MRQLCIIGPERSSTGLLNGTEGTFELEGVQVRYGIIETPDLSFDPDADKNADMVLLRVRAFSCNYRDRALILRMATSDHRANYYPACRSFHVWPRQALPPNWVLVLFLSK